MKTHSENKCSTNVAEQKRFPATQLKECGRDAIHHYEALEELGSQYTWIVSFYRIIESAGVLEHLLPSEVTVIPYCTDLTVEWWNPSNFKVRKPTELPPVLDEDDSSVTASGSPSDDGGKGESSQSESEELALSPGRGTGGGCGRARCERRRGGAPPRNHFKPNKDPLPFQA